MSLTDKMFWGFRVPAGRHFIFDNKTPYPIKSHEVTKPRDWCLEFWIALKFDTHLSSSTSNWSCKVMRLSEHQTRYVSHWHAYWMKRGPGKHRSTCFSKTVTWVSETLMSYRNGKYHKWCWISIKWFHTHMLSTLYYVSLIKLVSVIG